MVSGPINKAKKPFEWTPERLKFLDLFICTDNASEAYRLSHGVTTPDGKHMPAATLRKRADRLLDHPAIQRELQSLMGPFFRKFPLHIDGMLRETAIIAFANMGDYFDFTGHAITLKPGYKIPRWAQAAIQSMDVDRKKTRKKTGEKDAEGNDVYAEVTTEKIRLKLYQKSGQLELLARKFGVADPKNIAHEILKLLPPDLRAQVGTIILSGLRDRAAGERSALGGRR